MGIAEGGVACFVLILMERGTYLLEVMMGIGMGIWLYLTLLEICRFVLNGVF